MMEQEDNKPVNGLWAQLQDEKAKDNVVVFDPSKGIKIEEIEQLFKDLWKSDQERRVRMDKEYTDIGKVTLQEIEEELAKWGDDVPNGLMCKIKIAGSYQDWPIKALHQYLKAVEKEVQKWKDGKQ
jgi:hypothetical protein